MHAGLVVGLFVALFAGCTILFLCMIMIICTSLVSTYFVTFMLSVWAASTSPVFNVSDIFRPFLFILTVFVLWAWKWAARCWLCTSCLWTRCVFFPRGFMNVETMHPDCHLRTLYNICSGTIVHNLVPYIPCLHITHYNRGNNCWNDIILLTKLNVYLYRFTEKEL